MLSGRKIRPNSMFYAIIIIFLLLMFLETTKTPPRNPWLHP